MLYTVFFSSQQDDTLLTVCSEKDEKRAQKDEDIYPSNIPVYRTEAAHVFTKARNVGLGL